MIYILKSEYLNAVQTWWIQLEILTSVSRFEQALNSFLQFRTGFWRFSDAVLNCVNSASVNLFELYEMTTSLEKEKVPPEISTARILTLSILYFQYFRIYHYLTNPLPLSNCLSVYLSVCGKDNPLFVFHLSNYFRTPVYHFRILQGIDRYSQRVQRYTEPSFQGTLDYRQIQRVQSYEEPSFQDTLGYRLIQRLQRFTEPSFQGTQGMDRYREYRDLQSHHFMVLQGID